MRKYDIRGQFSTKILSMHKFAPRFLMFSFCVCMQWQHIIFRALRSLVFLLPHQESNFHIVNPFHKRWLDYETAAYERTLRRRQLYKSPMNERKRLQGITEKQKDRQRKRKRKNEEEIKVQMNIKEQNTPYFPLKRVSKETLRWNCSIIICVLQSKLHS